MALTIAPVNEDLIKEAESNSSTPLPKGKYLLQIVTTKANGDGIETIKFGGQQSAYSGHPAINIRFRVAEGEHEGRNVFKRLGLFTRYLPTQKNPDGAVNRDFISFFTALGVAIEPGKPIVLPDEGNWQALLGKYVVASVSIQEGRDGYGPSNEVSFFEAASGPAPAASSVPADAWAPAAPVAQPAQAAAPAGSPWDPNGPTM